MSWLTKNIPHLKTAVSVGGGTIQTTAVTSTPYTIVYTAQDALGNRAPPAFRTVSVVDPCSPERYCTNTGVCASSIARGPYAFCYDYCRVCQDLLVYK